MKYIFFGTPEFAEIVLEKLINAGYIPEAIVCNPDELVGRKKILTPPPTKILAEKYGINILQPEILTNYKLQITNYNPDLAIVAAYGKIIPQNILTLPHYGTMNVHPSLLPKYRGASPIQNAILNGDKKTGVTIMKLDEEMDHGKIISSIKYQISKIDTYESLSQKLAILGAELLIKTIPDYVSGKIKPIEQKHSKATYTKIIKKEYGKIDWSKSAEEIERITRAFYPWPSAWTIWNKKLLKIIEVKISKEKYYQTGEVFLNKNNRLAIKCSESSLIVEKLQLEGGKILSVKEFLNGHKDFVGAVLPFPAATLE